MKGVTRKFTLVYLFINFSIIVFSQQTVTKKEPLFEKTCRDVYETALGNRSELNFNSPINDLSCDTSTGEYYHCLTDYPDRKKFIQFCGPLTWIELEKCPALFSSNDNIQPFICDANRTKECPKMEYKSYFYYKYPGCFLDKKDSNGKGTREKSSGLPGYAIAIIVIVIVILVAAVIVFVFLWRRSHQAAMRREEEVPLQKKGHFKHKRAIKAATEYLKENKEVLITGKPGSGKETFIEDLVVEFPNLKRKNIKDDAHGFGLRENTNYFVIIPHLWMNEHGADGLASEMATIGKKSLKAIATSYKFMQNNTYVEKFKHCTIDLSNEFELKTEEKQKVIEMRCNADGVTEEMFTAKKRDEAAKYKCKHYGFLRLIDDLFQSNAFDNPVQFLTGKDRTRTDSTRLQHNDSILEDG